MSSRYGLVWQIWRKWGRYNIYFKMKAGVVLEMEVLNLLPTMSKEIYMQKLWLFLPWFIQWHKRI